MYIEGKACWLNHLDAALKKIINRLHGTTSTTPFEISSNDKPIVPPKNTDNRNNPNFKWGTM